MLKRAPLPVDVMQIYMNYELGSGEIDDVEHNENNNDGNHHDDDDNNSII